MKPEFFSSADIADLSLLARLLYIGLWCEADREGRLEWKPKTFKIRYLPCDDCDIVAVAQELLDKELVVLYGEGLAYIPTFLLHQHVNPREAKSTLPEPKTSMRKARVANASARVSDTQVGKEGKGKERKGRRDTTYPNYVDNPPSTDEVKAYARQEFNLNGEFVRGFVTYYQDLKWHHSNGKPVKSWKSSMNSWVTKLSAEERERFKPKPVPGEVDNSMVHR